MANIKFGEMNEVQKNEIKGILFYARNLIVTYYFNVVERAIKLLSIINGGGTITILTFIHSTSSKINWMLNFSLIAFLFGIILLLILVALDYQQELCRINDFDIDIREFYSNKTSLDEIRHFKLPRDKNWVAYIGYASGSVAAIGIGAGIYGYFTI